MSIVVISDSSQRPHDRLILAVFASLALHAAVVVPFFVRIPEKQAEAAAEQSVTVELVPELATPEKAPEPKKEQAVAKTAERSPPGAPKPKALPSPSPSRTISAPAELTPPAAPTQPFEASAPEEADAPPDPVNMPAPDGKTEKADRPTHEPTPEAASKPAEKTHDMPSLATDAPVAAPAPGEATVPSPTRTLTSDPREPPPMMPEVLAGRTRPGEGQSMSMGAIPMPEARSSKQRSSPPIKAPAARDMDAAVGVSSAATIENVQETPMTPAEQAIYLPQTPAVPQTKPSREPGPKAAKTIYAKNILSDPRVRGALSTLSPEKRMSQICGIEAAEQARHASAAFVPDLVVFEKDGGRIFGMHLSARGGAVRSRGVWREMAFDCTVNTAADTITAFRFSLGETIPRSAWGSRGLVVD